jgi:putative ABC transport system permease protein
VNIAVSHATLEKDKEAYNGENLDGWNSFYHTYVRLKENASTDALPAKFKKLVERHMGKEGVKKRMFNAMPLTDIHFEGDNFNKRSISRETISTLRLIGVIILVLACINFTNLASAQAIRRAREVGIRKTLGSTRANLVLQFLGETFVITAIALILSFVIVSQLADLSQNLTDIPLTSAALRQPAVLIFMFGVLIVVTLLSGFYPAFVLSGFNPSRALKNVSVSGTKGLTLRKGLIAFQFIISQVLIISTFIVIRQTNYFDTKPLGFNKESVLTADIPLGNDRKLPELKNNLMRYPEIINVSYSLNTPSATINKYWAEFKHISSAEEKTVEVKLIDSAYFKLFEIPLLAGSARIEGDTGKNVVVNETFIKEMGLQDPEKAIGETIEFWEKKATIVGVVRDFQTVTLHQGMHPVLMTRFDEYFQKISVKIDPRHSNEAIAHLEKHWKETFPQHYFTYTFLDQQLATFYKEDRKISRLLSAFATVAIAIGCVGLLGLIMFIAAQRTKEVGIRKILGATVANIVTLLSKDFIRIVAIAAVIAWPVAFYAMSQWLENISYKID